MVEKGWGFRDHGTWWIEQIDWMILVYWEWWISIEATKSCYFGLALSGIGSQPTRLSDVVNLKNYMRYQVDFLLPLKLQKICYFGLCHKILLVNQFAVFFTFDLFDLLILIPGVHCYIVFIGSAMRELVLKPTMMTPRRVIQLDSCIN